jgi:DNA-binding transcriptional MerR regulator
MLRYLESSGLVVPQRTRSGYRVYGLREVNQLRALRGLRKRFRIDIGEVAFAERLRREPELRAALDSWLHGRGIDALDWEQRKHERLLAA